MENNQHINSGNAAAKEQDSRPFSNSQPGQQLPAENKRSEEGNAVTESEQHSESSLPENGNETLGTP